MVEGADAAIARAVRVLQPVLPAGLASSPEVARYAAIALLALTTVLVLLATRAVISVVFGGGGGKKSKRVRKRGNGDRSGGGGAGDGPHVLVVGTEGAGKTVMCSLLLRGEVPFHDTVTSMEPTRRSNSTGELTLTDFPGSSQARNSSIENELASASAVVFLVDASRFCKYATEARATAALMKRVLTSPFFVERSPPMLVAFNKVDLLGGDANKPGLTLENSPWLQQQRDTLQAELNAIKDEMLTSTGEVSDAAASAIQLGSEEDFEFEVDVVSKVTFATCTTTKGVSGCTALMQFAKRNS